MRVRFLHWLQQAALRLPTVLPSSCALCGADGATAICSGCRTQFFNNRQHRCIQCAVPLPEIARTGDLRCGDCLARPPAFDATIVAADYAAPIDQLVLALKFGNRLALAPLFAHMLRDALLHTQQIALPTQLTAVPLGARRLHERGFNQALEIAKPLSRALGIRLERRLALRLRDTQAQAMLPPDERHNNIRHAFVVANHAMDRVRGQHIGVVDDVITTGETLNEMALTLKRFGAVRVTNFVFARTAQK